MIAVCQIIGITVDEVGISDRHIEEEAVTVVVTDGATPIEGIRVYLFSAAGAYLGRYENTDINGEVKFDLPLDMDVKFRADYLGYQFWSNEAMVLTRQLNSRTMLHKRFLDA